VALLGDDPVGEIKKIEGLKNRSQADLLITQGDDLVRQKKYDEARQVYASASKLLENDRAAAARVARVDHIMEYVKRSVAADKEYEAKNWSAAAADYEQALALTLEKEDQAALDVQSATQKAKHARSKAKELEGDARKAGNDAEGAAALYRDAVQIDPANQEASQKLVAQESRSAYDQKLADARKAWADGNGDYAQAMTRLDEAVAMQPDPVEKAKLLATKADWSQLYYMKEGQKAENAKDLTKARDMYEKAANADPSNKERQKTITRALQRLDSEEPYQNLFTKAAAAFKRGDYTEARRQAKEAAKILNKGEVKDLLQNIDYQEQREQGLAALKDGRYSEAIGFFHLAQKARDTDEIKGLIQEAEAKSGGGK
jgi:tetratricopeptide (TPR) repeat protein